MIPEHRIPTHPGEILLEEFLNPMEIPQTKLAEQLGISVQRVNELVNGKRGITPETAWLLAGAFGTTPQFWTNLQAAYDLAKARPDHPVKRIAAAR
jgi:antitoxin HigA-1